MSDFTAIQEYVVENISRPVKYIIYKLTEFIRVVDKFVFRQVPAGAASGYATIEQIEGNTVVWNQLVDTSDTSCTVPNGHKYYSIIGGTKSISTSDGTSFAVTGGTDVVIDITAIFGAGNEPTTIADFEAWMAQNIGTLPYYDYNAGELLSVKMSGMQTQDSSQQTLDTIALDVTTITGINTATNVREVIFPNGMNWLTDSIYDVIDLVSGTATKMCGNVNLGDLTWGATTNYTDITGETCYLTTAIKPTNCKGYETNQMTIGQTTKGTPIIVKYVAQLDVNNNDFTITTSGNYVWWIYTDNARTAQQVQSFMQDNILIYVLTTPITYTDLQDANGNPLNPRYKVEQGGTEQVLPVNTSSPTTVAQTLTTVYTKDVH